MRHISCNFLSPTSPVFHCAPDFCPGGPSLLPGFFSHCPSPCRFSSFPSSLPIWLPLHHHHAVIIPLLSEHMANPFPSSPLDFIADLLYTCSLRNCVVFRMCYSYQILRIHLRHVSWNLSSFFSSAAITGSFHASHPYNRTSCSKVLKSLIFVFWPTLCVFQIFKLFDIFIVLSSSHYFVFSSCIHYLHFAFLSIQFQSHSSFINYQSIGLVQCGLAFD